MSRPYPPVEGQPVDADATADEKQGQVQRELCKLSEEIDKLLAVSSEFEKRLSWVLSEPVEKPEKPAGAHMRTCEADARILDIRTLVRTIADTLDGILQRLCV